MRVTLNKLDAVGYANAVWLMKGGRRETFPLMESHYGGYGQLFPCGVGTVVPLRPGKALAKGERTAPIGSVLSRQLESAPGALFGPTTLVTVVFDGEEADVLNRVFYNVVALADSADIPLSTTPAYDGSYIGAHLFALGLVVLRFVSSPDYFKADCMVMADQTSNASGTVGSGFYGLVEAKPVFQMPSFFNAVRKNMDKNLYSEASYRAYFTKTVEVTEG